jgi:phosphoribosylglycinamide formyltransferase-1
VVDHKEHGGDRQAFEQALQLRLDAHKIDIICLAGFMRLLTPWFVERWHGRMLNIHPSLLPAFKGLHTHERALAAGVKVHGATVHFVMPDMDSGPIIVQGAVPVTDGDDADTLAARVLAVEHRIYPLALRLLCLDAIRVDDGRCIVDATTRDGRTLIVPDVSADEPRER